MKRKLFFCCLINILFISSAYAKCDGGTQITNSVGTTFCKSNHSLSWWSSASWCKANDMHLATIYELCPTWDGTTGRDKCPELKGKETSGMIQVATASGDYQAYCISLDNYVHNTCHRNDGSGEATALCAS